MSFMRKYGTLLVTGTTAIRIPIIKRAAVDFAVGADWTPVAGDVKVFVDGAAVANIANLPTAIAAGNTAFWEFILTASELTCKQLLVTIADAATKAIEDQSFIIETYGNASAMYAADLSLANLPANVTQLLGTAWLTPGTAGTPDVNTKLWNGLATVALPATPTNITAGTITTTTNLTNNNDKTGYALSSAGVQAIWDALTSALTAVGSIGKKLADWVIGTTQTGDSFARLGAPAGASVSADIAAVKAETASIQADTDNIQTRIPTALVGGRIDASVGAMAADVVTAAAVANGAIDAATFAAGAIDAAAIATDALGALELSADAVNEIADGLLDRNMATGVDSGSPTVRTPRQALRGIRNKASIAAGTLTITKEDDVTASWTAAVATSPGNPISSIDPA